LLKLQFYIPSRVESQVPNPPPIRTVFESTILLQ
jgi:hypothetical protein